MARKRNQENPIEDMPGGSVSGCILKVERERPDIDDPGAYCAAIADRIEPGWRSKKRKKNDLRSFVGGAAVGAGATILTQIVRGSPATRYERFIERAEQAASAGNLGEARRLLQKATDVRGQALGNAELAQDQVRALDRRRDEVFRQVGRSLRTAMANPVSEAELVRRLKL